MPAWTPAIPAARSAPSAAARADSPAPSPALALLEGICHVELGEDALAEPLLRQAETSAEQREAARLFLGILRLRSGDAAGAAALFDAAAGAPGFSRTAADLGRLARRDGKLVLSLLADAAWDSNVTLAPLDGSPGPGSDAAAGIAAAALWRPLGPSGPYARASGSLQRQLELGDYDFTALDAAAGWQHQARSLSLAAEYDLASRTLGGEAYLTAHRLLASLVLGRRTTLAAIYSARLEDYAGEFGDFSGVVHRGELRMGLPLGTRARLGLSYLAARDLADADDLSYLEHGPRADLWVVAAPRLRLGLEGGATLRRHDRADPTLGVVRDDVVADALAVAELDLGAHLTARLAVQARRAYSSSSSWEYSKLVPSLSLLWVTGL